MAFNFPPGPNYTDIQSQLLFTTDIIELTSNLLLACPISIINFILILKTSIIHPNLKLIILCQSLCIFIRGIGRIILNFVRIYLQDYSTKGPSLLAIFYLQPLFIRNCIMHVMVIERIMATLKSKNYEKNRNIFFHIIWIIITTCFAFVNSFSSLIIQYNYFVTLTYSILFLLGIFEIWTFFWILNHNKRNYEKKLLEGRHLLSERYQICENIRTSKQLIPCFILHFINLILPGIYVSLVTFGIYSGQFNQDFTEELLYLITTFISFLIELSMIMFHPFLKREFLHYLIVSFGCRILKSNNSAVVPLTENDISLTNINNKTIKGPIDIDGHLFFTEKQENITNEYFKQLTISWQ
ncbi:hypothetical protein Mgra_00009563 [Meloidogyne graminicola]|uniref:Uncharacterized protein n=1 Tax=Meloidogyne graminicola TaxID=189291 RepID=A0A8S9ZC23_9BILA|nr:hypothetical protein Mgra_00009563 [Meloidogyne graminicola]